MDVAVLGAGYAGLALTRRLESALPEDVELTLVDERDTHLVQHLVHRVVRRPDLAETLQRPLAALLDRTDHRQARVESVDPEAGTAALADGRTLEYDVGAVCLGARTNYHGIPGVAEHGTPLKRVADAEAVRERFLDLCEADGEGRAVVGGAGLSGIQVAGELAALARVRDATETVEIRLVEQAEDVAPTFPAAFRRAVAEELAERGVTVETGAAVKRADADAIALSDGTTLAWDQFVWTGGITGPAALDDARPRVRARLRLGGHTLGLGDAVTVVDADGTAVPPSARSALGQAAVAATNVARLVAHQREGGGGFEPRLDTYRDDDGGWLVTVGDGAVATVGPTVLRGRAARTLKTGVSERYLRSVDPDRDLATVLANTVRGHD